MKDSMVEDLKNTIVSKNEDPKFIEELFQERDLELEKKEIAEYNKEQGIEEGIEKGIEQGIEQGIVKGQKQGALQERKNLIAKLINKGFSDNEISNLLDISPKQLTKFKRVA